MTRLRYLVLPLLFLFVFLLTAHAAPAGSTGRAFTVTVPYTSPSAAAEIPTLRLLITTTLPTQVSLSFTATGASQGFSIGANSSFETILDTTQLMLPSADGLFNRTLRITSTEPVGITMVLDRGNATEAFTVLPDSSLGAEYLAVTGTGNTNGTFVAVVGVEQETRVTIVPTRLTKGGKLPGQPFTVTLNRGDVYQIMSDGVTDADLTGTSITATRPVGVISGSSCEEIRAGRLYACNPLIEQLPPISAWGTRYVAAPLAQQQAGLYKILGSCDGTELSVNGVKTTIRRGESIEVPIQDALELTSSAPVLLTQFVSSTLQDLTKKNTAFGDPSMIVIPAVTQWTRSVHVRSPELTARFADAQSLPALWKHFAQIAIAAADEFSIRHNGAPITVLARYPIGAWVVITTELGLGDHVITADSPFSVLAHGYSAFDAYGYAPELVQRISMLSADPIRHFICGDVYDTTIAISNDGDDAAQVSGLSFIGDIDGVVVAPATFPVTIPPGGSQSVTIRFRRIAGGMNRGTVVVNGGGCGTQLLTVPVEIYTDMLQLVPAAGATLDFGGVPPTVTSVDSVIVIYNAGNGPLTLNTPDLPSAEFVVLSPSFPVTLPPKGAARVVVRFRPNAGSHSATISFTSSNCPDSLKVALTGRRESGPFVDANPPLKVRKLCAPKARDTIRFVIANRGDRPMTVSGVRLVGRDAAAEFTLLTNLAGAIIAPEGSTTALVEYRPGALGAREAALELVSDAINRDTITIQADVRNDSVAVGISLDTVDFGATADCDTPPVVEMVITNSGTLDIAPLHALIGRPGDYAQMPTEFSVLGLKDTVRYRLQLRQGVSGTIVDSLMLANPLCSDTLVIPIRGSREAAAIAFDRDTLDFGPLPWCADSAMLSVTLRNSGNVAVPVGVRSLPVSADMVVRTPSLVDPLKPGEERVFTVTFMRGLPGEVIDSLLLLTASCDRPIVLVVRGRFDDLRPDVVPTSVDFAAVKVGATVRRSLWVRNPTSEPVAFGALSLGGRSTGARIVSPAAQFTVGPDDSVEVIVEYSPQSAADSVVATLTAISSGDCIDTLVAGVAGVGAAEPRRIVLWWEDASGNIGERLPLRLRIRQEKGEARADSVRLLTSLTYDASMLLPIEVTSMVPDVSARLLSSTIVGRERVIELELLGLLPTEGAVAELRGLATLGLAASSPLRVGAATATLVGPGDTLAAVDSTDGVLRLDGLCEDGGARLIRQTSALRLELAGAHPIRGATPIEFDLSEDGRVTLSMIGSSGDPAATLVDERLRSGGHRVVLDPSSMAGGFYILRLATPSETADLSVIIVK